MQTSLAMYNRMNAVEMLQHNVKAMGRKRKNDVFYRAVHVLQRYWRGAIQRRWIRVLNKSAIRIQAHVRKLLVQVVYNKEGRRLAGRLKAEALNLCAKAGNMTESEYLARKASLV